MPLTVKINMTKMLRSTIRYLDKGTTNANRCLTDDEPPNINININIDILIFVIWTKEQQRQTDESLMVSHQMKANQNK